MRNHWGRVKCEARTREVDDMSTVSTYRYFDWPRLSIWGLANSYLDRTN